MIAFFLFTFLCQEEYYGKEGTFLLSYAKLHHVRWTVKKAQEYFYEVIFLYKSLVYFARTIEDIVEIFHWTFGVFLLTCNYSSKHIDIDYNGHVDKNDSSYGGGDDDDDGNNDGGGVDDDDNNDDVVDDDDDDVDDSAEDDDEDDVDDDNDNNDNCSKTENNDNVVDSNNNIVCFPWL